MHEHARGHAVAVNTRELAPAAFRIQHQAGDEERIQANHHQTPQKAPFLTYGAEDEVRGLLRHKAEGGLRALQEAFPEESAGANRNLGLQHVVAYAGRVLLEPQQHLYTAALVRLQHVLENIVGGEHQRHAGEPHAQRNGQEAVFLVPRPNRQQRQRQPAQAQQDPQRIHIQQKTPRIVIRFMGRRYPHAGRQEVHVRLHLVADVAQHKGERAHHQHKDAAVQEPPLAQVCRPLSGVAQKEHGGHQHHRPIGAPPERSHKEYDNQADSPQPPAGKPLPVQHEDEPGIHQGTAGLALANNHQHGYANDKHGRPKVLPARNAEVLLAHHVGEQERGRYLGNLCRLEADGPQVEPRMGALDVG